MTGARGKARAASEKGGTQNAQNHPRPPRPRVGEVRDAKRRHGLGRDRHIERRAQCACKEASPQTCGPAPASADSEVNRWLQRSRRHLPEPVCRLEQCQQDGLPEGDAGINGRQTERSRSLSWVSVKRRTRPRHLSWGRHGPETQPKRAGCRRWVEAAGQGTH